MTEPKGKSNSRLKFQELLDDHVADEPKSFGPRKLHPPSNRKDILTFLRNTGAFEVEGTYSPGMTTEILTDAFMKVANLHEEFSTDQVGALRFVLDLAKRCIQFNGSAVFLTNINDPDCRFHLEALQGKGFHDVNDFCVPIGQGFFGEAVRQSQVIDVSNLREEGSTSDEMLLNLVPDAGACLFSPILYERRLMGLIFVHREKKHTFLDGEKNVVAYLSSTIAKFLASEYT